MLYIYRKASSVGARDLADYLEGRRYRAVRVPIQEKLRRGDIVICWGERLDPVEGVKILNGAPLQNKMHDALKLKQEGVPTVEVSSSEPPQIQTDTAQPVWAETVEDAKEFVAADYSRTSPPFKDGVRDLLSSLGRLHLALQAPLPELAVWLPRQFNHVGGNDLLAPPVGWLPDYWSRKENIVREFRIHSFRGKSIRAGVKVPREVSDHPTPIHPWIRSLDGGWKISYDGVTSRQAHRELAHLAVSKLGLEFGAVDIAEKADGGLIVLEVNRAPGLEGGTIQAYANAIETWLEEE